MAFPLTNWTLLAQATLNGDENGQRALDEMCAAYRTPVVSFLASRGYREQELDDLAQEFFLRWLKSRSWKFYGAVVDCAASRGSEFRRFRSWCG